MGLVSPTILPVTVLCPSCWSLELLGEALLGIFCSCSAATLPYTVIPLTSREVIELSNTPKHCRWEAAPQTAFASL